MKAAAEVNDASNARVGMEGVIFQMQVLQEDDVCPDCSLVAGRYYGVLDMIGPVARHLDRCARIPKCRISGVAIARSRAAEVEPYEDTRGKSPIPAWLVLVLWLSIFACVAAIVAIGKLGVSP